VELQRFQLTSEKTRLELDLSSALPLVLCDAGRLQQILMNLISNARHALLGEKAAGVIRVRTRIADSGHVILEVSDSGPGIPEARRHRIFDPFFTTKPSGLGTGLGLSIVMGLVRQNHGNIQVHSGAGQGATFSIDFPAHAGPAAWKPSPHSPSACANPAKPALVSYDQYLIRATQPQILPTQQQSSPHNNRKKTSRLAPQKKRRPSFRAKRGISLRLLRGRKSSSRSGCSVFLPL
jgi:anti-sigma regulatory factor (Ser/Thr protein kinase)